jgi:hypothetical protein
MAGLFKTGDSVLLAYQGAIGSAVPLVGQVATEETPGMYRVSIPMGIAVLMPEASLTKA